jgi:RecB family exonuclease
MSCFVHKTRITSILGGNLKKHISYSELKIWAECPFKHKLIYFDKIREFIGNEFTAFGKALHALCEHSVQGTLPEEDQDDFFDLEFLKELEALKGKVEFRPQLVQDMRGQAKMLSPQILPALAKTFPDYEVFSVEERLYETIQEVDDDFKLKGFIDLVIKDSDGIYHIIDWKTCSWGWDVEKRSSKLITYQLTLYKEFFCRKHKIDPKMVETHFALLKRTAKKDNVEIFRVTSGPKKTKNALKLLTDAIANIKSGFPIKNRKSCNGCEYYKTKHCT